MAHQPLEELRQLFADKQSHNVMGLIKQIEVSPTRQTARAMVSIYPHVDGVTPENLVVAKIAWSIIDNESGVIMLPDIGDLCIVKFIEGDEEQAYITDYCSTQEELLPQDALDGSLVLKARKGKPIRVLSDTKILLQKGKFGAAPNADASNPLVLGDILQSFIDQVWAKVKGAKIGICAVGPVYLDPALQAQIQPLVDSLVDQAATNFLSQISFTERGN